MNRQGYSPEEPSVDIQSFCFLDPKCHIPIYMHTQTPERYLNYSGRTRAYNHSNNIGFEHRIRNTWYALVYYLIFGLLMVIIYFWLLINNWSVVSKHKPWIKLPAYVFYKS